MDLASIKLAESVHEWAMAEIGFKPQKEFLHVPPPTVQDIKKICRGNMVAVWQFLLERVKSEQHARHVRDNLLLHGFGKGKDVSSTSEHKRAALIAERDRLKAILESQQKDAAAVAGEVKQLLGDLVKAEKAAQSAEQDRLDSNSRAVLLEGYAARCRSHADIMREYGVRLKAVADGQRVATSGQGSQYYATGKADSDGNPILESHAAKRVRECVEKIQQELWKAMQDEGTQAVDDETLRSLVKNLGISPAECISGLTDATRVAAKSVEEETEAIDIFKDARALRFKFEGEGIRDKSDHVSNSLRNVEDNLEQLREEHIERFMSTERSLNDAMELEGVVQKMLTSQREGDEQRVASSVHPQSYKERNDLVRRLQDLEIEFAAETAAASCVDETARELSETKKKKEDSVRSLQEKYMQIQRFEQDSVHRQELIHNLIRLNMRARKSFSGKKASIHKYIEEHILPFRSVLLHSASGLHGMVSAEVEIFDKAEMQELMFAEGIPLNNGKMRSYVKDLSIHRIANPESQPHLVAALQALGFPAHKGAEEFLPIIEKSKHDVDRNQFLLRRRMKQFEDARSGERLRDVSRSDKIMKMVDAIKNQTLTQDNEWVPRLEESSEEARKLLASKEAIRKFLEEWWSQPAQNAVPFLQHNGKSIAEWVSLWHTLCVKARQS